MTQEEGNRVITFGCRLNSYESELIKDALKKTTEKNLIVFNSCAVTNKAEQDLASAIRKTKKENYRLCGANKFCQICQNERS